MRVRISYGMEIEDIPDQAETLGREALRGLQDSVALLNKAIDNIEESEENYSLVLKILEKTRLKLTKSDLIITDLQAILEGLHDYYNGEEYVSEGRPLVDSGGNTTTQTKDSGEG